VSPQNNPKKKEQNIEKQPKKERTKHKETKNTKFFFTDI